MKTNTNKTKRESSCEGAKARSEFATLAARVAVPGAYQVPESSSPVLPTTIMVFPAGQHEIHATRDGRPFNATIQVDEETAAVMQDALEVHLAGPQKPFFDFNHENKGASAWPQGFFWRPEGVFARVKWSDAGAAAIVGKTHRSFSPTFFTDGEAGIEHVTGAPLNMGGLVNDPAFEEQAPIWAEKNAKPISGDNFTGTTTNNQQDIRMKKILELLGLAENATEDEILAALTALKEGGEQAQALAKEVEQLRTVAQEAAVATAKAAVADAVKAGRIPPKNTALQAQWEKTLTADPSQKALLDAIAPSPIAAAAQGAQAAVQSGRNGFATATPGLVESARGYEAARTARERGAIYAQGIAPVFRTGGNVGAVLAANALGKLSGDLVTQRALDLLYEQYPWLFRITTDFTDEEANFGQTVVTRTKGPITAGDYSTTNGYVSQDAQTPSVEVKLDKHKFAQVTFNVNELSGTSRDLIGEQAEVLAAAIGDAIAGDVIAAITAAAFTTVTAAANLAAIGKVTTNALAKQLVKNKVPQYGRILLLSPDAAESLSNDAAVVALSTNSRVDVFQEYTLPRISGFQPYQTNAFPTSAAGSLAGFACTGAALALVTRLPGRYSDDGAISVVSHADGLSLQKVDFVDHSKGSRSSRLALMYGVAAGAAKAGVRLTITAV